MDVSKKTIKILSIVAFFLDILLSLYFAGMVNAIFIAKTVTSNPVTMYELMKETGFPTSMFVIFMVIIGGIFAVAIYMHWAQNHNYDTIGRRFKYSRRNKTYGDAHFEEPYEYKDIATIVPAKDAYGPILGQLDESGKKVVNYRVGKTQRLTQHMCVFAPSGSGKTFTFVKSNCFQIVKRRESVVITDPKGELYGDMSQYFRDHGYVVRRLDLRTEGLRNSDGWDCLKSVRGDTPEATSVNALMFADVVCKNIFDNSTSVYAEGAQQLLKALILRVLLGHDYPEERKNIASVCELLHNPGGEAFLDTMFDPATLSEEEMECHAPYLSFKASSPNLRGNIMVNLDAGLQVLQNKTVTTLLSTDDIDLELPGYQPCAYFCMFPANHDTFRFIVSLFFSMLFIVLIDSALKQPTGALPIPVNFLMDEFPSIGIIPDWDRKMATIRSNNINAIMIFQDVNQFVNIYKETYWTILGNCSVWLCLGVNDEITAKIITNRIGDTTVQAETSQYSDKIAGAIDGIGNRMSRGEGRRSLLSIGELYEIPMNRCLIIFARHNPIWAYTFPHTLHPEVSKLKSTRWQDAPALDDYEAKEKLKEEEKAFVDDYLEKHPLSEVDRKLLTKFDSAPKSRRSSKEKKAAKKEKAKVSSTKVANPVEETAAEPPVNAPDEESEPDNTSPAYEIESEEEIVFDFEHEAEETDDGDADSKETASPQPESSEGAPWDTEAAQGGSSGVENAPWDAEAASEENKDTAVPGGTANEETSEKPTEEVPAPPKAPSSTSAAAAAKAEREAYNKATELPQDFMDTNIIEPPTAAEQTQTAKSSNGRKRPPTKRS